MKDKVLKEINGELVELDNDIADLIVKLNENDYTTYFSCSSHPKLKDHNGYIMFEYKKETFDMLMDTLDNICDEIIFYLQLEIEISKLTKLHVMRLDIQADKVLVFRFRCTNTNKYKLVLEMFKHIENKIKGE